MLHALGADVTISLVQEPEALEKSFQEQIGSDGVNVILDYLWGLSAEHLLIALAKASEELRSSAVEPKGSGVNSIPVHRLINSIGKLFKATVEANFELATQAIAIADIQKA